LNPAISAMPNAVSAAVALQAQRGIIGFGMNAHTSPVYAMNSLNRAAAGWCIHNPKRLATAERNAAPSANLA
jgi:hypothetical protein